MALHEYWRRMRNKNFHPSVLLINAKPFFFPKGWITESYSLGSVVQYANKKDDPFVVLPSERCINLSIQIPMEQIFHKTYYSIAKQVIRATTLLCTTTKTYTKNDDVRGSEKISIFDGMSYKFPIKKSGSGTAVMSTPALNTDVKKAKLSEEKAKIQAQIEIEKAGRAGTGGGKKKFQFSKMALPHWVPVACGYFGYSVQSLGCILTSFSTSASANENIENWNISLVEYEWKNTENIDETENLDEKQQKMIQIEPDRKIHSTWNEEKAKINLQEIEQKHQDVKQIVQSMQSLL